ncbi:hypothetical protein [Azohydromonas lata]|uniref:Uncharacterized protein n=1 Tax=Azohydromonas lata TaxID=45677 RepID=A0ABU5IE75_9BURK|nr:hypothetical protein [Azohydromonas lata]MDZ5456815.1 hypothetical protein [Azohydromonas lata]
MSKDCLASQALVGEIEQQLRLVPLLRTALEGNALFELTVAAPSFHERDHHGRNWDVAGFRSGFLYWPQCHDEFRRIVDRVRARYDLAP